MSSTEAVSASAERPHDADDVAIPHGGDGATSRAVDPPRRRRLARLRTVADAAAAADRGGIPF